MPVNIIHKKYSRSFLGDMFSGEKVSRNRSIGVTLFGLFLCPIIIALQICSEIRERLLRYKFVTA